MADMFLERTFDAPLVPQMVIDMAADSAGCFSLYRVDWLGSLLSSDGRRMVCWFRGPDTEYTRTALRQAGADDTLAWPGTVHMAPVPPVPGAAARVLVERHFDEPVSVESLQAVEDAGARCLEAHGVRFLRTFFSRSRRRMLCLYQAPDAEAVRLAQQQAGMPVSSVWTCRYVHPAFTDLPTP